MVKQLFDQVRESSAAGLKKGQRPDLRVVNSEQTRVRGIARFPVVWIFIGVGHGNFEE
jgi:hypothetical protein